MNTKGMNKGTDRHQAWEIIRDSLPGLFYSVVSADNLSKELRLSTPVLKKPITPFHEIEKLHQEADRLDAQLSSERELLEVKQAEFSTRWDLASQAHQDLDAIIQTFWEYEEARREKWAEDKVKIKNAKQESQALDKEILVLKKILTGLANLKDRVEARAQLCLPKKEFLEICTQQYNQASPSQLVKGDRPYESISDLTERFGDLKEIREEKAAAVLSVVELAATTPQARRKEFENHLLESLAYRNYQQSMEKHGQKLGVLAAQLESSLDLVKGTTEGEILKGLRPQLATYTLYCNLAREVRQKEKCKERDLKGQLNFIQKFLKEMVKVRDALAQDVKAGSDLVHPSGETEVQASAARSSSI